jgi:hypothetical protein
MCIKKNNWDSKVEGDDLLLTQRYRKRLEKEPFGKKQGGCYVHQEFPFTRHYIATFSKGVDKHNV